MSKKLNVQYWTVPASGSFVFPEVSDSNLSYDPIKGRPNCGIAFSGGGTVSAALAPGFIKALEDLGLMKNVRYISGVSGGTWGTAAYCYALDKAKRQTYFGKIEQDLKLLNAAKIKAEPQKGSMTYAVTNAKIVDLTLKYITKGHEAYTRAVGEIFLDPFGIDQKKGYFTTDQKAVEDICSRNQGVLSKNDFLLLYKDQDDPGQDSPYYIMNGSFLTPPKIEKGGAYTSYPFEFTPLYCGMKANQGPDTTNEVIGGSYVESFGFNTVDPKANAGAHSVSVSPAAKPLILSSPVGTSGSAIEKMVAQSLAKGLTDFLPAFEYWNPVNTELSTTQEYLFGDGGIAEDTGISPLLARKVENIVLFITEPFDTTPISDKKCEVEQRYFGYNQIAQLFGAPIYKKNKSTNQYYLEPAYDPASKFFDTSNFKGLSDALMAAKKDGAPIVVQQTYDVQQNLRFGVEGGWKTTVTWVVVDTCKGFNEGLPSDVYHQNKFVVEGLENFPAICTFGQNTEKHGGIETVQLIQLTNAQANLLANQAYWMLHGDEASKRVIEKALQAESEYQEVAV